MHKCNNPCCCNPAHLVLGTIQENNLYKLEQGRFRVKPTKRRRKRFTEEQVMDIKLRLKHGHGTFQIACTYGASTQSIRDIRNGVTWSKIELPAKQRFEYDPFADE